MDFLYIIDLFTMLILFFGFGLFSSFNIVIKIIYLPLVIYFLFGEQIGILVIDIIIQLLSYLLALYVIYKKYLIVFHNAIRLKLKR